MEQLEQVRELSRAGLFRKALEALEASRLDPQQRPTAQVLRAELLERVGRSEEAEHLIRRSLAGKTLTWSDRSLSEFTLARIAIERGERGLAIDSLSRAISSAERGKDIERTCLAQLKLLVVLSDGPSRDATGPLLAEVRTNAARAGNPRLLAAVHVYFAQIEGYRSSVNSARRHLRLAHELLARVPDICLQAIVSNIELGLALMASDFEAARIHGEAGRKLAELSGGTQELAINQGNLGCALQALGGFDEAVACYERALALLAPGGQPHSGILDSLARIRLSQDRLDECENLLDRIKPTLESSPDGPTFVSRHVQVTRARLSLRKGDFEKARQMLESARQMSHLVRDPFLSAVILAETGHLQLLLKDFDAVKTTIDQIAEGLADQPAYVYGRYQELLAAANGSTGRTSNPHFSRAARIYGGLHHEEASIELKRSRSGPDQADSIQNSASDAIQSIAAIMTCYRHTEFVALEFWHMLAATDCFENLRLFLRHPDGREQTLASRAQTTSHAFEESTGRLIRVGSTNVGTIFLELHLRNDLESIATFHAASSLLYRSQELSLARDDRAERSTLWPADEFPPVSKNQVISGHMRELMNFAQRVARTSVNVLITGESGTGKEILARAIHDFSDRAQKPFVPLNCAAVPRDLLESQLFGHRRGAFTGADRDQLGLIRSAADGTLFLDEVAEMSIDLQPKLLRFLESGEIAPLGEPSPFSVNVRLVAATNANLDDAVRDGKFREDLFYRLNVVRLSIRPLRERRDEIPGMVNHFIATAAREYTKGHVQVSEDTMERLLLYRWPGNVRQLQNEMRRMVALAEPNATLEPDAISGAILAAMPDLRRTGVNGHEVAIPLHDKLVPTLSRIEYEMIKAALREHKGKVDPAAKSLGISRKGLYLKRQRLGL